MRVALSIFLAASICTSLFAVDPPPANASPAQEAPAEHDTSVWMRKKMDYSQAILQGLAMGDFEAIRINGERMSVLNKVEGFVRRRNPHYKMHVREFERISNEIVEQAKQQNLAGVTLAFNQLTVNCVNCHSAMRQADTQSNIRASSPDAADTK